MPPYDPKCVGSNILKSRALPMYVCCHKGVFSCCQVFFFNPSPEVPHYRNQATVEVLDEPYTVPFTPSPFVFPFYERKFSVFGVQLSSSTGLSRSAGNPPKSPNNTSSLPWGGLHLSRPVNTFTAMLTSGSSLCHCGVSTCCRDIAWTKMQVTASRKRTHGGTDCRQQPAIMLHLY